MKHWQHNSLDNVSIYHIIYCNLVNTMIQLRCTIIKTCPFLSHNGTNLILWSLQDSHFSVMTKFHDFSRVFSQISRYIFLFFFNCGLLPFDSLISLAGWDGNLKSIGYCFSSFERNLPDSIFDVLWHHDSILSLFVVHCCSFLDCRTNKTREWIN